MKPYFLLVLASVIPAVLAIGASGCKKPDLTVSDAGDAAVEVEAAAPVVEDAGAEAAAAPLATATATAAKTAAAPTGGVFQGTYRCFGGMKVTQSGNSVTARLQPGNDAAYSTVTCTVSGDRCEGTASSYTKAKDKPAKAFETRKATLKRSANGDLTYQASGEAQPTNCHKD